MKTFLLAAIAAFGFLLPQSSVHSVPSTPESTVAKADLFASYSIVMVDDIMCRATTGSTTEDIISIDVDKLDGTNVMSISGCFSTSCTIDLSGLKGQHKVTFFTDSSNTYSDIVTVK